MFVERICNQIHGVSLLKMYLRIEFELGVVLIVSLCAIVLVKTRIVTSMGVLYISMKKLIAKPSHVIIVCLTQKGLRNVMFV